MNAAFLRPFVVSTKQVPAHVGYVLRPQFGKYIALPLLGCAFSSKDKDGAMRSATERVKGCLVFQKASPAHSPDFLSHRPVHQLMASLIFEPWIRRRQFSVSRKSCARS